MPGRGHSQWPQLFDLAVDILDRFREAQGRTPGWSFGGGTALMLQIDHRESHDIDIFLDDSPRVRANGHWQADVSQQEQPPDSQRAGHLSRHA